MIVKFVKTSTKISIIQAYFEPDFIENLSIFEPQIEKYYAYKNNMYPHICRYPLPLSQEACLFPYLVSL